MRTTHLTLILTLTAALLLAGCGGGDTPQTTQPPATDTQNTQTPTPPSAPETPPAVSDADALIATGQELTGSCLACHSVDGSAGVGPTWQALYGHTVTLEDDSTVVADEDYIKRSILEPGTQLVKGFTNVMPAYQFNEEELAAVIAYIRSLAE